MMWDDVGWGTVHRHMPAQSGAQGWWGSAATFNCDNTGAVAVINCGYSHIPQIMHHPNLSIYYPKHLDAAEANFANSHTQTGCLCCGQRQVVQAGEVYT